VVFDNGNTRRASDPNAHSRGQAWKLDEETMTATLVVNADLGGYSGALGAAQQLSNGNYSFTLGTPGAEPPVPPAHTIEVTPNGTKLYDLKVNRPEYRSFRMRTLYAGTGLPLVNGKESSHEAADRRTGHGHDHDGGHQSDNAFLALSLPTAGSIRLSPSADAMSIILASLPSPLQSDGLGLVAHGFVPSPAALVLGDVERLDQLFAAGMEDEASLFSPKSRRNPSSFADEIGLDVVSWE